MIRVRWELEEAVALYNLYFKNHGELNFLDDDIERLCDMYRRRANLLGLTIDDKFRNSAGLKMQLSCIHYVVTKGDAGLSSASKLFYDTYDIYNKNPEYFEKVLEEFNEKYK